MYLDCKERMSCLVLSCISNTLDTSYTSCSQNGRHVLICGRWPASRRPCAKLTNTTILSYRWLCITGLWNHDPGIPQFFCAVVLIYRFLAFLYRSKTNRADDWINDWNTNKNDYFQFTFYLNDLYTSTHMTELSSKKGSITKWTQILFSYYKL